MTKFHVIVAMDENRGIGKDGDLPWHLSKDLKYFARITKKTKDPNKQNAVIMGRKTWESIPDKYRPLKDRLNIVLSRNADYMVVPDIKLARTFDDALEVAEENNVETIFVIGGAYVFEQALIRPDCDGVYLTEILKSFNCDAHLAAIDENRFKRVEESEIHEEKNIKFRFVIYRA
jgi:dihydrofolate reductase